MTTEQRDVTIRVTVDVPTDMNDAEVGDLLRDHIGAFDADGRLTVSETRVVTTSNMTHETRNDVVEPCVIEERGDSVRQDHPAWALARVVRSSGSPRTLFDSEIQHSHTVTLSIARATRERMLSRDWLHAYPRDLIEIEMSEVQWAALVSSMGMGTGVPVTLRRTENEVWIAGIPYAPRMQTSLDEIDDAARETYQQVWDAFEALKEKRTKANMDRLETALSHVRSSLRFVATSMTGHAEETIQRAQADIEAMAMRAAAEMGISRADLPRLALGSTGSEIVDVE